MVEALAKNENSKALANLPAHLKEQVGNKAGRDNLDRDDILIPRLCLAQALSPQLNKKKEEYIEDLEVGEFFNSVTGAKYGEVVRVIPLHFFKQFIEFAPKTAGGGLGGITKMYMQGEVPPAKDLAFGPNQEAPKATEFKNRMCLMLKEDGTIEPIVVSFKVSGLKTARRWNFLIAEKNLPAYAYVYELHSTDATNKSGQDYKGVGVERDDYTPAALFASAEQYFAQLQDAGVKVDTSGLDVEENLDADPVDSKF